MYKQMVLTFKIPNQSRAICAGNKKRCNAFLPNSRMNSTAKSLIQINYATVRFCYSDLANRYGLIPSIGKSMTRPEIG